MGILKSLQTLAKQLPESIAVSFPGGGGVSYRTLLQEVEALIEYIKKSTNTPKRYLLLIKNPIDFVEFSIAIIAAEQSFCGANVSITTTELCSLVEQIGIDSILTDDVSFLGHPKSILVSSYKEFNGDIIEDAGLKRLGTHSGAQGIRGLIHTTSGTSGVMKAVIRDEESLLKEAALIIERIELAAKDKLLITSPLYHSYASGFWLAALMSGATTHVLESNDLVKIALECQSGDSTILITVPYVIRFLSRGSEKTHPCKGALRLAISGGASLESEAMTAFSKRFNIPLAQEYGLSEAGIVSINYPVLPETQGCVGIPLSDCRVEIAIESERGSEIGEVVISRELAPKMYLTGMETNTETYKDGKIYTGDIGMLDADGNLKIIGRKKLQINVSGNKVDPNEVESVIYLHPGVEECAVTGSIDPFSGERVDAYVKPQSGEVITESEIVQLCKRHLSKYKIPRCIRIVSGLPKTTNGKLNRGKLNECSN